MIYIRNIDLSTKIKRKLRKCKSRYAYKCATKIYSKDSWTGNKSPRDMFFWYTLSKSARLLLKDRPNEYNTPREELITGCSFYCSYNDAVYPRPYICSHFYRLSNSYLNALKSVPGSIPGVINKEEGNERRKDVFDAHIFNTMASRWRQVLTRLRSVHRGLSTRTLWQRELTTKWYTVFEWRRQNSRIDNRWATTTHLWN